MYKEIDTNLFKKPSLLQVTTVGGTISFILDTEENNKKFLENFKAEDNVICTQGMVFENYFLFTEDGSLNGHLLEELKTMTVVPDTYFNSNTIIRVGYANKVIVDTITEFWNREEPEESNMITSGAENFTLGS